VIAPRWPAFLPDGANAEAIDLNVGGVERIGPLAAAGVPIWIGDEARIAHPKTMVIHGATTNGAVVNSEDLDLVP
jgi:hypothetical protein